MSSTIRASMGKACPVPPMSSTTHASMGKGGHDLIYPLFTKRFKMMIKLAYSVL